MNEGPQCYITSFKIIGLAVPENKNCEGLFAMYWHSGNFDHVTKHLSLDQRRFHMKFGFAWQSSLSKFLFLKKGHIQVYSPGAGADDSPVGSKMFYIHKPSVTFIICCKCFPFNDTMESIRYEIWSN